MRERTPLSVVLWVLVLLVVIVGGAVGAYQKLANPEEGDVVWGLLVPGYVFFALAATGSSLVNSIYTVFDVQRFKPVIKRGIWLSLILVVPAWIFILADLGRWFRMWNIYTQFHVTSRLAWMGVLYLAFGLSLLLELIVVIRERRMPKWVPVLMGIIVLMVTLGVHTNLGALFGAVTNNRPLWSSHLLAAHFIISAMTAGAMFHILFNIVTSLLKRGSVAGEVRELFSRYYAPMVIGLIVINWVLIAIEYIPALFSAEEELYAKLLLTGRYAVAFWLAEIVVGGIIPLVILLSTTTRRSVPWLLTASCLVVLGVFFSKYDLLIGGQSIQPAFEQAYTSYFAHAVEWLLFVGAIAVCLLLYTLGELLLPLEPEEEPVAFIFGKRAIS